jgi:hypothetical protein
MILFSELRLKAAMRFSGLQQAIRRIVRSSRMSHFRAESAAERVEAKDDVRHLTWGGVAAFQSLLVPSLPPRKNF